MNLQIIQTYEDFDRYFEDLRNRCKLAGFSRVTRYESIMHDSSVFEIDALVDGQVYRCSKAIRRLELAIASYPYHLMALAFEHCFEQLQQTLGGIRG